MTYAHKEAFCLMIYQTDDGTEREVLWNSRDGVTPFVIGNVDGTKQMTHVQWEKDRPVPDHIPEIGSRIFEDWSAVAAREHYRQYVDEHWNSHAMWNTYESKEQAIEKLVAGAFRHGTPPTVTVVDDVIQERFRERASR